MPPIARPFPRFIADATQEGPPTGRFKERLDEKFAEACAKYADEAGSPLDLASIRWFPERAWGGRVWVPATGASREPVVPADAPEGSEPVTISRARCGKRAQILPNSEMCRNCMVPPRMEVDTRMELPLANTSSSALCLISGMAWRITAGRRS